jgi:hypothetical protein
MRTVLRLLGSRYGIALVLIVVVLAIVGVAKAFVSNGAGKPPIGPVVAAPSTPGPADASLGDDSEVDPSSSIAGPSLSANTPSAATVASLFMTAWLHHTGVNADQWRAGLEPNATASLMGELAGTDPEDVPASTVTGKIDTNDEGAIVEAVVPVNGGTVTLRLLAVSGRWKVDGVDWNPS